MRRDYSTIPRCSKNAIDRRFYRKKYEAEKTLAAFSASLHQEVDLEDLQNQLMAVVEETFQPEHVTVWLQKGKK